MGKLNFSWICSEWKLVLFIDFDMITVTIGTTVIGGEILNHRSPIEISLYFKWIYFLKIILNIFYELTSIFYLYFFIHDNKICI